MAPLSTGMFSPRSSAEPSTDVSTDVNCKEVHTVVVSVRQHSQRSPFSETSPVAIEALLPADLGFGSNGEDLGDMRSALDRLVRDVAGSGSGVHKPQASDKASFVPRNIRVEAMAAGVQAGTIQIPSTRIDDVYDETDESDEDEEVDEPALPSAKDALGMDNLKNGDDPLSESIGRELKRLEVPKRPVRRFRPKDRSRG